MKPVPTTALIALALAAGGCTKVRGLQGFIVDQTLVAAVKPGVDNRASVERTLGRPTFTGQFNANDWFYISRETRGLLFKNAKPVAQSVVRVRFNPAGNVVAVDRTGIEKVASISPARAKTPTLGKNRGFFEELFGNIGQVGAGGTAGRTADNPAGDGP